VEVWGSVEPSSGSAQSLVTQRFLVLFQLKISSLVTAKCYNIVTECFAISKAVVNIHNRVPFTILLHIHYKSGGI